MWGTTGTTQALAPADANSLTLGALRLVVGGIGLFLLAIWTHTPATTNKLPQPLARHRSHFLPLIFGVLGVAGYQLCFFAGVARTGVAVGTIVAIGSAPVMTGILAALIFGEQITRRWLISTALAVAGCTVLVVSGGDIGIDVPGITLSLGAGFAYAVYTLASKSLLTRYAPEVVMALLFCGAGLLLSPILLTSNFAWVFTFSGLIVTLHLGILATTLSYAFFARGLLTVPASTAVTLSLAEPLTATLLGLLLLAEHLTVTALFGILLLFSGLFFLTLRESK